MTNNNTAKKLSMKVALTMIVVSMMTVFAFQNCSSTHNNGNESQASSTPGVCVPAAQSVVNDNAQSATQVLTQNCASCHSPSSTNTAATAAVPDILNFSQLENGYNGNPPVVKIGSPETSPLYIKVVDGVMPDGGKPLSPYQLSTIRNWILGQYVTCDTLAHGPGNPQSATGDATFTQVNNQIIQPYCYSCHGDPSGPKYSPDLSTFAGVQGAAATCLGDIQNGHMPQNSPPLSSDLQNMFAAWVNAGTPNN